MYTSPKAWIRRAQLNHIHVGELRVVTNNWSAAEQIMGDKVQITLTGCVNFEDVWTVGKSEDSQNIVMDGVKTETKLETMAIEEHRDGWS